MAWGLKVHLLFYACILLYDLFYIVLLGGDFEGITFVKSHKSKGKSNFGVLLMVFEDFLIKLCIFPKKSIFLMPKLLLWGLLKG